MDIRIVSLLTENRSLQIMLSSVRQVLKSDKLTDKEKLERIEELLNL